jgi:ABC-type sugar transport system substrate-binding protein
MKRAMFFVMLVASLILLLAACGTPAAAPTQAPAVATEAPTVQQPASEEKLFVFLPKGLDNPYWDNCRKGMESEMAKLGVKAEFIGPEKSDATLQVGVIESVIARKPAAIAISPNDPATVNDLIAKATAAGIKVITWDADAPDSQRILYIGTDNYNAGATAAETLSKVLDGKGKVAILNGALTALNAQQRTNGFKDWMAKNAPGIEIVADEPTNDDANTSASVAESILQAHPDLAAFYGVTGNGVPGAYVAVKGANKCGIVHIVGFDVVPQGIEAMRAGCVDALISQRPFGMTAKALDVMVDLANGKTYTEKNIDTGVEVVYPDTLETFLKTDH